MRHGFLLVDKPEGPTSHDCVAAVRRALHEKKVGHLGTLDPAATGLLVMAVGAKALKVVELFNALTKEYDAAICFGSVSSTYDKEGVIEIVRRKPGVEDPTQVQIQNVIQDRFLGSVEQVPPGYSAVKVGGERAYRKMRQGRGADLPSRTVEISMCDILSYDYPHLVLRVECGSGTYIRSIAHDLGHLLRCGAYLEGLKRTKVGDWSVEDATPLDRVAWPQVIPLKNILADLPRVELSPEQAEDVRHGRDLDLRVEPDTIAWLEDFPIAILAPLKENRGIAHARKVI